MKDLDFDFLSAGLVCDLFFLTAFDYQAFLDAHASDPHPYQLLRTDFLASGSVVARFCFGFFPGFEVPVL